MLFNTLDYFLFLPTVVGLFILLRSTPSRLLLLLAASYFFYASWNVKYLTLIIFSTILDYFAALRIASSQDKKVKTFYLLLSVIGNLSLLFVFKYYNFFISNINYLLSRSFNEPFPFLNVLLPVGISFYTFQTLSYTIDVYRGVIQPERSILRFALYVSFFPQLVAGPIERARHLLPQLRSLRLGSEEDVKRGFIRILIGLFKKMVVADTLALYVSNAYASPLSYDGFTLLIATLFFAFQIYLDFLGYSDIAIGSARLFGIHLMENFRRPYFAQTLQDFWRRWHISLTTWFREYVYIPLGGKRKGIVRHMINILIVFLLSGIWHGAAWTFIIWGLLHGFWLSIETLLRRITSFPLPQPLFLFNFLYRGFIFFFVLLTWVFFRAPTIQNAFTILKQIFSLETFWQKTFFTFITPPGLAYTATLLTLILALDYFEEHVTRFEDLFVSLNPFNQYTLTISLIISILLFGMFTSQQFIYFQF